MTGEDKRSCLICKNKAICHMHRQFKNVLSETGWMLGGSFKTRAQGVQAIYEAVGKTCTEYQEEQEAETK